MWFHIVKLYNYPHAVNVSIGLIGGGSITDTHARAVRAVAGAVVSDHRAHQAVLEDFHPQSKPIPAPYAMDMEGGAASP